MAGGVTGRLWVLGDSWTDPRDPEGARCGWPQQVAGRLGMGLVCSGQSGAGYVNINYEGGTYLVQAVRGTGAGADAVICWGSVNDRGHPPGEVYAAATETYRLLRLACPGAPLLVYGPQHWETPPGGDLPPVRDAVARAAAEAGALFIDPLLWMQGRPDLLDGTAHPSCAGNDLIADRVTPDLLLALLARPAPPGSPGGGGWPMPLEAGTAAA